MKLIIFFFLFNMSLKDQMVIEDLGPLGASNCFGWEDHGNFKVKLQTAE